ncbi:MAG: hypothetical protein HQL64_12985 [Magnetococcales bacterium]|nr:hypothetical protein [Magnetococcales bacterium]
MPHAHDPASMTPEERLNEVAAILAGGIKRLVKKKKTEKIPLDKSPDQCPYVHKTNRNGERT